MPALGLGHKGDKDEEQGEEENVPAAKAIDEVPRLLLRKKRTAGSREVGW